ncbi:hypothetical protein [Haloferula sp.]|uniref:hypothetical protein n=1 Tax=Haloferula sp. TaxID=2497595 RepID=UPI00329DE6C3
MPTKLTKVACQSCGANLSIDESIRFVTCGYCSAQLEIVHDPSTIHSKLLEDVVKRQDAVEDELRILRLEKQIQRLERNWESFRARVSTKGKDGTLISPNKLGPILFGLFAGTIGLISMGLAATERQWVLALLAIGALMLAYFVPHHGIRRANEFAMMRSRYIEKRSRLRSQLSSAERTLRFAPMKRSGKPSRSS